MTGRREAQPITIRKARPADVDQVCELLFGLKTMYGSCVEQTLDAFRERYAPAIGTVLNSMTNVVWVAEESAGTLVAFLSTTRRLALRLGGEVGVLEEVFVRPTHRRQGIAFQLWRRAMEELRSQGVKTVEVVTSLAHPGQREFAKKIGLEWYASIHRVQL